MGYGDAVMATAVARQVYDEDGPDARPVAIGNGTVVRWSTVFEHNPFLATQAMVERGDRAINWVINCAGHRPYLDYRGDAKWYKADPRRNWTFTDWRVRDVGPGVFYFNEAELAEANRQARRFKPFIVIEPHNKRKAAPGKDWTWRRYSGLAMKLANVVRLVQLGPRGTEVLEGVEFIETPTFRQAAAVLAEADAYLGTEGGLHHAAAAVGLPGVVIFGGFISPWTTGYLSHINLYAPHPLSPCGQRIDCAHCRECMESITVADVASAFEAMRLTATPRCAMTGELF